MRGRNTASSIAVNWCARRSVAAIVADVLVRSILSKACIILNPKFAPEIDSRDEYVCSCLRCVFSS